jgi:exodeoxyribonuclease VII small subunit
MAKKITFEEAFRRLEEIAGTLERGEIPLDESMKLYEEGMELIDFCAKKLDSAEMIIRKLSKTAEGKFETPPAEDLLAEN